jgi:hypothetical protein
MDLLKEMTINGQLWELYYCTGTVVDEKKWSETEVTGGGSGGYNMGGGYTTPVNVHVESKTTRHDQVMLQDSGGKETTFKFEDMDLSCRQGNVLTVIRAIQKGKKYGHDVLIYNHQSEEFFWKDDFCSMFYPARAYMPFLSTHFSWWPIGAAIASPFVLVALVNVPEGVGIIVPMMPFIVFFLARFVVRGIGKSRARAYLDSNRRELVKLFSGTLDDAATLAEG